MSLVKCAAFEYRKLTNSERKAVLAHDTEQVRNWRIPNATLGAGLYGGIGYFFSRGFSKPTQLAITGLSALGGVGIVEYSTRKGMEKRKQWLNDKNAPWYYSKDSNTAIFRPHTEDLV
jgi:hypothetical protein